MVVLERLSTSLAPATASVPALHISSLNLTSCLLPCCPQSQRCPSSNACCPAPLSVQEDDVRKYVNTYRRTWEKNGKKQSKAPKIQRLVTPLTLQRE